MGSLCPFFANPRNLDKSRVVFTGTDLYFPPAAARKPASLPLSSTSIQLSQGENTGDRFLYMPPPPVQVPLLLLPDPPMSSASPLLSADGFPFSISRQLLRGSFQDGEREKGLVNRVLLVHLFCGAEAAEIEIEECDP